MTFWSGQRLSQELRRGSLVSDFEPKRIDCASYTLRMGPEFFVTSDSATNGPKDGVIHQLMPGEAFRVSSGQFAALLTEESISLPADTLAFISMKSRLKFQGLINVSGFHVDPGYRGRLIFSVYNAGPSDVQLRRGDDLFLIWFADLDEESEARYRKNYTATVRPREAIDSELVSRLSGHVFSPMSLMKTTSELAERVRQNTEDLTRRSRTYQTMIGFAAAGIAILIALGAFVLQFKDAYDADLSAATNVRLEKLQSEMAELKAMIATLRKEPASLTVPSPSLPASQPQQPAQPLQQQTSPPQRR